MFTFQEIIRIPEGLKNMTKVSMYIVCIRNAVHKHSTELTSSRTCILQKAFSVKCSNTLSSNPHFLSSETQKIYNANF